MAVSEVEVELGEWVSEWVSGSVSESVSVNKDGTTSAVPLTSLAHYPTMQWIIQFNANIDYSDITVDTRHIWEHSTLVRTEVGDIVSTLLLLRRCADRETVFTGDLVATCRIQRRHYSYGTNYLKTRTRRLVVTLPKVCRKSYRQLLSFSKQVNKSEGLLCELGRLYQPDFWTTVHQACI